MWLSVGQRVFSYYADASRGGNKLGIHHVVDFFTDFEVIPRLISRREVERIFFAAARRADSFAPRCRFACSWFGNPVVAQGCLDSKNPLGVVVVV